MGCNDPLCLLLPKPSQQVQGCKSQTQYDCKVSEIEACHLLSNGRSKLLRNRSMQDLRDLFTLRSHTNSDTYDCMCISHLTDADSERLLAAPGRWRNQASIRSPAKSVMHTCRSCLAACRLVIVHMAAQLPEHEYRHRSS